MSNLTGTSRRARFSRAETSIADVDARVSMRKVSPLTARDTEVSAGATATSTAIGAAGRKEGAAILVEMSCLVRFG